eukprot:403348761
MLTCKACKKIYNTTTRQPQFMTCGHPICQQCFTQYEQQALKIQDEKYQCPIKVSCQQTQISKNVATYILDLLEEAEIFNIFCDKHPKNTAQYFCKQDNLLICETCMLTDHSNHLKPQAHVHFNSESKEVFTKRILPILKNKKERLDSLLESFELSQENEIAFSASKYKTLIDEVKDVLYDKQVVQEFDLSKQQILVTKGETPQNDEEKKDHEEIDKNFKISGNFPKDNGFKLKIDDQIFLPPIQKFRDLVDQELKESYLLHTAFGNELQIEYNLLFRGSEDGFTNLDFRKKCCFAPNIIIFVLSEFDQVFGGFVSEIIQQKNGYIQDQGAFLFQLTKRQLMFQNGSYDSAVQCNNDSIIGFGGGYDLQISSKCDQCNSSFSNLGNYYCLPEGLYSKTIQAQQYLAGQYNFKVLEIEVYQAKFIQFND